MKKSRIIIGAVFLSFMMLANINYVQGRTERLSIIDDSGNKEQTAQFTTNVQLSSEAHADIKFSIPVNGSYKLNIYNMIGEQVAQLLNEEMNRGNHELQFDASHLSSGVYLYSLVGKNVNITRKMILMK